MTAVHAFTQLRLAKPFLKLPFVCERDNTTVAYHRVDGAHAASIHRRQSRRPPYPLCAQSTYWMPFWMLPITCAWFSGLALKSASTAPRVTACSPFIQKS